MYNKYGERESQRKQAESTPLDSLQSSRMAQYGKSAYWDERYTK